VSQFVIVEALLAGSGELNIVTCEKAALGTSRQAKPKVTFMLLTYHLPGRQAISGALVKKQTGDITGS